MRSCCYSAKMCFRKLAMRIFGVLGCELKMGVHLCKLKLAGWVQVFGTLSHCIAAVHGWKLPSVRIVMQL